MSERFHVSHPVGEGPVTIAGPEAHHLLHVLRGAVGREVTLFDGSGDEFTARIAEIRRGTVSLEIVERKSIAREPARQVTLAVALPKGDRQQWLVEKATELGVARLTPLISERGVAQPTDSALERLARWVIEASKQCGRNRLMEIGRPQSVSELAKTSEREELRWVAHPCQSAKPVGDLLRSLSQPRGMALASEPPIPVVVACGPEGGFTEQELVTLGAARFETISLGPSILRVETAALAIAAAVVMGDLHAEAQN